MAKKETLWNNIKIEHVEEAIRRYTPKTQKGKVGYFVIANNEEYPARQIRRLSYGLANGIECTSDEIHGKGGKSVQKFFEKLQGFKERGYICINVNEVKEIERLSELDEVETFLEKVSKDAIRYFLREHNGEVSAKQVTSNRYIRSKVLAFYVKELANGICQLCEREAPFLDKNGRAYLETHHIIPLSCNGKDDINNMVAICPNCHRKIHCLELDEDISKLMLIAKNRKL